MLDMCTVKLASINETKEYMYMPHLDFKLAIAEVLCKSGKPGFLNAREEDIVPNLKMSMQKKRRGACC